MIHYMPKVEWYCDVCGDEGESETRRGAEQQVAAHECTEQEKNDESPAVAVLQKIHAMGFQVIETVGLATEGPD